MHARARARSPLVTSRQRREGRREREREASSCIIFRALESRAPLCILSPLLPDSGSGRRVIVHAWIAVVMRDERSRMFSRISYDTVLPWIVNIVENLPMSRHVLHCTWSRQHVCIKVWHYIQNKKGVRSPYLCYPLMYQS